MSHSAEQCKRGTFWALSTCILLQKYQKTRKGDSFETLKIFEKSCTMPKKIERGEPLGSSGFVGYVKKVKHERGDPFALIAADRTWPYGSSFSSFDCKKSGAIRLKL